MKKCLQKVVRTVRNQSGQSLAEYAVILFLVGLAAIIMLRGIGGSTNNMVSSINDGFSP